VNERRQLLAARRLFESLAAFLDVAVAVRLWDGSRISLREGEDPEIEIAVADPGVLGQTLRRPRLETLLHHYASGRIELRGGDPLDLLRAFAGDSRGRRRKSPRGIGRLTLARNALPLLFAKGSVKEGSVKKGSAKGSEQGSEVAAPAAVPRRSARARLTRGGRDLRLRDSVRFHYDLGNDFYALFLDPEMQYSCAYFEDWDNALEAAQVDKLEMICRKLLLAPGERLLDVGCGWGGLACYAARHYGVKVLGVTLSAQQLEYARRKVRALDLEDRVEIELRDYRELCAGEIGSFDKIASVGMIEHVGIANYPGYFAQLASLLRDRGLLLNHGITRAAKKSARRFRRLRPEKRLMLRYVFPGHELDHIGHTLEVMEANGYEVRDVEDWREHYALTTRHWCKRLAARSDASARLVGGARHRTWLAYLAGVSAAFTDGSLRVYQVLASRQLAKGASELPPTRAHLYS
jgi:cyclopropane-fatty-acyl-phospholipid synthase